MIVRRLSLLALAVVLFVASGCGSGGPAIAEVEGTVKLNGRPLDKIQVEFWPEAKVRGPSVRPMLRATTFSTPMGGHSEPPSANIASS